jgi:ABC-2 type transport system ATP-binding protein
VDEAIVLRSVTKSFGPKVAVRDLDLVVPRGGLYGFIGPNGAGKTTTIRMILSILFPDRGDLSVLGHRSALEAKDRIGYLPEERGLYRKMRVGAFLAYMGRLKSLDGASLARKVRAWLERLELGDVEKKRCEDLSKGMQQKVQFIAAVLHEPDLLILDEPFSGLDPINTRLLRDLIFEQNRRGATVLFSTHVMAQAEQISDHVVMIHEGQKVLDDRLDAIRRRYEPRAIRLEPLDPNGDLSALGRLAWARQVSRNGSSWEIAFEPGFDPGRAVREAAAAVPLARVELVRPSLEDIFVEIVSSSSGRDPEEAGRLRAEAGGAGEPQREARP